MSAPDKKKVLGMNKQGKIYELKQLEKRDPPKTCASPKAIQAAKPLPPPQEEEVAELRQIWTHPINQPIDDEFDSEFEYIPFQESWDY